MVYYPNVDPAYIYKRRGDETDPYIPLQESLVVDNGRVTLNEIPDFPHKVQIKKADGTPLSEVTSDVSNANQYKVDYSTGLVTLDESLDGATLTINYYGTGYVSFPASRIKVDTSIDNIENQSIQDLVRDMKNSRTNWLIAVDSYDEISTTYPNPKVGDTVQTMGDGKIYRFTGDTWINNQAYSDTALTSIQLRIDNLEKTPNEYEWTANAGQLTYVMPENTTYNPNTKWLEVNVGGAQISPSQIQKDNSNQFTLLVDPSYIPEGVKVIARWVEPYIPAIAGHKNTHEVGGYDEIDVTKLKNYDEQIANSFNNVNAQLADEVQKRGDLSILRPGDGSIMQKMKNEFNDRGVNIWWYVDQIAERYENLDTKTWDWTPAFLKAINDLRQIAINSNLAYMYTIHVPTGVYNLNQEVQMSPYIKIVADGYVNFVINHDGTGFYIAPFSDDPTFSRSQSLQFNKNAWNRGNFLNGSKGSITFTSSVDPINLINTNTIAIEIGQRSAVKDDGRAVSRYLFENVNVYGFHTAIKHNSINNYLGKFINCHLEWNNHAVHFWSPGTDQYNAGENIIFQNCIIASHKKESVLIDAPGHDISFIGTSFDFNASPVIKSLRSGTTITLSGVYVEKIGDGMGEQLLYQSEKTYDGENGGRNTLKIDKVTMFLQRPMELIRNIESNGGAINLYVINMGIETRYAAANQTDINSKYLYNSPYIFTLAYKIFNSGNVGSVQTKDINLLSNYSFEVSTPGVDIQSAANDKYWVVDDRLSISEAVITSNGGINSGAALKITATSDNNYATISRKGNIPVSPGDMFYAIAAMKTPTLSPNAQIIYILKCYDSADQLVSTIKFYDVPNITVTDAFWNGKSTAKLVVPMGTTYVKFAVSLYGFKNTYYIDEIHLSKAG